MKKVFLKMKEVVKKNKTLFLSLTFGLLVLLIFKNIIAALFLSLFFGRIFNWLRVIYDSAQMQRKFIHYEKKEHYAQYCANCKKEVFTQRMGNIYLSGIFLISSFALAKFYYSMPLFTSILIGLGGFFLSMIAISSTRCTKCYEKTEKRKKSIETQTEEVNTFE